MEELDFEDILVIHPDEDLKKIETIELDANSNLDQDSDSGEIDEEEEANDLEEGEIEDNTDLKKKSDIACRFFKRGSCAYGSQCQYLHVSNTVYKMFDTPPKRNDPQPIQHLNFPKPIIFPPNVLPTRPLTKLPISVESKVDFHRELDTFEDTWEKGLEQARILIQNANLRKKSEENEPKKFNSKNNKDEKISGSALGKKNLGKESDIVGKKYCEKASSSNSLRREKICDDKKSDFRYQSRSSDKWVDPWRRSKSPDLRSKLRSLASSAPSRSRKHSYASSTSSSSSSSEIESIYRRPYKRKLSRDRQMSRSRSISQSRQPKKRKLSPKRSVGKRTYRSSSRSFSRSPHRKKYSSSRSRSSSSDSCSDCQLNLSFEDKEMKRISAKLSNQLHQKPPSKSSTLLDSDCETSEMTVSSASCTSVSSDSEIESPCPSPSLKRNSKQPSNQNITSFSNKFRSQANPKGFHKYESNLLKTQNTMRHKDGGTPDPKKVHSYNNQNQNNCSFKKLSTDCKNKNAASNSNSTKKPSSNFSKNKRTGDMDLLFMYQDLKNSNNNNNMQKAKPNESALQPNKTNDAENVNLKSNKPDISAKVANKVHSKSESYNKNSKVRNVPSHDMQMLFMYQDLGNASKNVNSIQKVKPSNTALKPKKTDDVVKISNKSNIHLACSDKVSKTHNVPKQKVVLNLQPKSKDGSQPEICNKSQELNEMPLFHQKKAASKREQLLNKLKLIDDAIARKKSK